ncbi:methyltransferase [Paraburkholderia sp. JPY418]|nr:methyltransferase [Paraburkholderia youngii]
MASAILSNSVGQYLVDAIARGNIKTLFQLAFENRLQVGVPFIYNGHAYGKGFAARNKTPMLSLSENLDEPLAGKQLLVEFSKTNLVNDTASTRMEGSTHLFVFGYIADVDATTIRTVPYAIGDLVERTRGLPMPFMQGLELRTDDVDQFAGMDTRWTPSASEFSAMRSVPEQSVKELLCRLLGEPSVPNDWGGEESDVLSANLAVNGRRLTAAFLLKGPSRFHPMKPTDLGRNGDQLYRLFNIPADVFVIQHCHNIGAAVRKQALAFALQRSFTAPCRVLFVDGTTTARLLRLHGGWPMQPAAPRRRTRA